MLDSLRARLLVWYTAMAGVVIAVFGSTVCYLAWRTRVADLEASLRSRATLLIEALQPAQAGTFDLTLPPDAEGTDPATLPYHAIWTPDGTLLDRSDPDLDAPPPASTGTRTRDGHRELAVITPSGAVVLTGRSLDPVYREISGLAGTVGLLGAASLLLSFAGGWWIVGRALQPIDRIGRTARRMVGGDFTARIPIERVETELGAVAAALNEAFDRLHGSLERQQRFTADASHELRTPLATISTELQWALGRDRTAAEYRRSLESCRRAASRMQNVVERLLALARAEAGADDDRRAPIALDELVRQVVDELQGLADARNLDVRVDTTPLVVHGDPERLYDAIGNVVANAIHYNVPGGRVSISVRESDAGGEVLVEDTGIGIAPTDLPRVFEPFFRADPARSREAGGAGLGLALTRAIVERHGGRVTCTSEPARGSSFRLWLARSPAPATHA
jgi:signal transduction histidine kinase